MPSARSHRRLTPQRQAVLDVLRESTDHPTAAEIYHRVQQRLPGVAYATIYNALAVLAERGEVLRWTYGDAATRYEGRTHAHSHVACERCGRLEDVDVGISAEALQRAAEKTGFQILGGHTLFRGLCRSCVQESGRATG